MIVFDVPYLFESVGGPRALMDMIDAHIPDNGLRYAAVQMWKQRERIPGEWIARVVYVLIREGINPLTCFTDDAELKA